MDLQSTVATLRNNPKGIRFADLANICNHFCGEPRQHSTSHIIYRMPWPGDPGINVQPDKGMAKPHQVRQVIRALEGLQNVEA